MKTEALVEPLTKRELEILALLAANQPNKAIADQLNLSLNSVKWFARQIYTKLGVDNRRQAVEKAAELGLLVSAAPSQKDGSLSLPSGIVTFLFTDIEGSTPLWEKMPEAMQLAVAQHHTILRQAIEANGGQVTQIIGDAFQTAFRLATDGLCAALAAQRALRDAHWGPTGLLKVRMGLHTGPAELDPIGNAPYAVSHTLNRAARIMSAAHGGQILLSQETADLLVRELPDGVTLTDLDEHNLKGLRYPEHLYQVASPELPNAFPPLHSEHRPGHNLPLELTSFIGRQQEIAQVQELLKEHRLVTLTGSGGVGKTRLSIEISSRLLADMPDGVWFVDLAPISDPDLVPQTVAAVLGLHEEPNRPWLETLARFLSSRELLLVLDNCEHLLIACARLADALLHKAPKLKILTSSREALGISGEYTFRVPSLRMPGAQQISTAKEIREYEAVQLFYERARAVLPVFAIDENNAAAVTTICRRLDGIPLALELAAVRIRVMTAPQIAARLDNIFHLLTGGSRTALPRQQTLNATIDWSYALLSVQERLLLMRLSVFAGGWTLEEAEVICAGEGIEALEALDLLTGLVDKSLVMLFDADPGTVRYRMLETVRQYSRGRLLETGGEQALRDRHLGYFLQMGEQAGEELRSSRQLAWLARLENEVDNFRLALEWSLPGRVEDGLRLAAALLWFWHLHSRDREGAQWLKRLLEAELAERGNQPLATGIQSTAHLLTWSRAVSALIFLLHITGKLSSLDNANAWMEESIRLCREIGEPGSRELAWALMVRGTTSFGDKPEAISDFQESLDICRRNRYRFLEAHCLYFWGFWGEYFQKQVPLFEASLVICRELGDPDLIATCLMNLAIGVFFLGEYPRSRKLIEESLAYYRKVGNLGAIAFVLIWRFYFDPTPDHAQQANDGLGYFRQVGPGAYIFPFYVLAITEWSLGNFDRAESIAQEALSIGLGTENDLHKFFLILCLSRIAYSRGNLEQALQNFKEAVLAVGEKGPTIEWLWPWDYLLDTLAILLAAENRRIEAAKVFGAADEIYRLLVLGLVPRRRSEHDSALQAVHEALGDDLFHQSWQVGQALSLPQVYEFAKEMVSR